MTRLPLLPTLLVALAVAVMIGLGVWQLDRKGEKEALLALYARNQAMSSDVIFPLLAPTPRESLFRHSSINCLEPVDWSWRAGHSPDGEKGYRALAHCRVGAEGPGVTVDMGIAQLTEPPSWSGGEVGGMIVPGIDMRGFVERISGTGSPPAAMLIADRPAPGLSVSARPSPDDIPNNHLLYAIQWFFFAGAAAVIYWLALRRRSVER